MLKKVQHDKTQIVLLVSKTNVEVGTHQRGPLRLRFSNGCYVYLTVHSDR